MSKLRFRVVSFSSEDPDYPASQLNNVNPSTRGWQSVRFCTYPQEIGLELLDGDAQLSQIQLLSHQSKISSKIEIFVGQGPNYHSAQFKRLGYLSLDSNERSNFQARELKTVFVDFVGSYVRFIVNENHPNKQNIYSQVGVIAISLMGTPLGANGAAPPVVGSRGGGSNRALGAADAKANPYNDLSIDMNLDPQTANKLRQLSDAKAKAVENEDYMAAKQIKSVEQELKTLGSRLAQLDMAKSEAVMGEDYDLAKEIKDESDILRSEIEDKIMRIKIPGIAPSKTPPAPRLNSGSRFAPANPHEDPYDRPPVPGSRGAMGSGGSSRGAPVNVDDMVVGAGQGPGSRQYSERLGGISGSAKVKKVELVERPGFTHDEMASDTKQSELFASNQPRHQPQPQEEDLSHLPVTERPIRNKGGVPDYGADAFGGIDDDPNAFRGGGGGGNAKPVEQFPPGEHPLEGVPHFLDLPCPESLASKSREVSDAGGIVGLLGEYRTRCLFSKTWILREAVVNKTQLMLHEEFVKDPPGIQNSLGGLCAVMKVGVEDKIQQVLFAAIALLEDVIKAMKNAKVPRAVAAPLFDPMVQQLVERLADGNARLREGARKGLELLAASSSVGCPVVGAHGLRSLPPKQKNAWRPISARLQLLTDLVTNYGVGGSSGLTVDSVLGFPKNCGAFSHSTGEVRDEAKRLVVAVQKVVGTGPIEPTLKLLRPKQLEEYYAAFGEGGGGGGGGGGAAAPGGGGGMNRKGSKDAISPNARVDKNLQHAPQNPGGKVPTSAAKVGDQRGGGGGGGDAKSVGGDSSAAHTDGGGSAAGSAGNGEEKQDFTSCMFCGIKNKNWNENDLDVHYWKDCPLLISCPSCAQIVEIAGLPEHLLDECEAKDSYVPCDITGLAIRKNEFESWKKSASCVPAPNNCMYCPLCLASVEDSDEAWLAHLERGCPRNTRTNGTGVDAKESSS